MRQLQFEFVVEPGLAMDPRIQEELIARMAQAILAIIQAEGEKNHEKLPAQS